MILYNSENSISNQFRVNLFDMFEMSHCSQYKAILSSMVLLQQCCEVYFISYSSEPILDFYWNPSPPPYVSSWIRPSPN